MSQLDKVAMLALVLGCMVSQGQAKPIYRTLMSYHAQKNTLHWKIDVLHPGVSPSSREEQEPAIDSMTPTSSVVEKSVVDSMTLLKGLSLTQETPDRNWRSLSKLKADQATLFGALMSYHGQKKTFQWEVDVLLPGVATKVEDDFELQVKGDEEKEPQNEGAPPSSQEEQELGVSENNAKLKGDQAKPIFGTLMSYLSQKKTFHWKVDVANATTQHEVDLITASSDATTINKLTNATSQHKVDLTGSGRSKHAMLSQHLTGLVTNSLAETFTGLTASEHPAPTTTTPEPTFVTHTWSEFYHRHKQACLICACVGFWCISISGWASWGNECQSHIFDRWLPAVYEGKGSYALFVLKFLIFVIVMFPSYFWHAYWDWPRCSAHEPTVRNHLHRKKHVFSDSVIQMICYRRNMMLMSFLFSFLLIVLNTEDFFNAFSEVGEYAEWKKEIRPLNYSNFVAKEELNATDPESFKLFTFHAMQVMSRESMKTTAIWNQVGDGIGAVVATITTLYLGSALNFWDEFRAHATQVAWFISIFGPFLHTVVPLKSFVNTDEIKAIALEYDVELQKFTNHQAEYYAQQALEACEQIAQLRASGFLDYGVDTMKSVCVSIRRYTPNKHLKCCKPLWNVIDAPFDSMHSTCDSVDVYLSEGNVDQARYALKLADEQICMAMNSDFKRMASGEDKHAMNDILQKNVVAMLLEQISMYETAVTTGLTCFSTIIVPALAIAQGMLRAAWAAKLIVPQSSLPGFLILILPWLFVPFTWGIYTMIYQFELSGTEGQGAFYAGLIIMALSGLIQTFGGLAIQIQKPMNDAQVEDAYVKLAFGVLGVYLVGFGCVAYFIVVWIKTNADMYFESTHALDLIALLSQYYLARPVAILRQAVSYFNDFFLTQMAATDFLVASIAQQWAYDLEEERLAKNKIPPQRSPALPSSSEEEGATEEVSATEELPEELATINAVSRVERLDCLIWVSENSMEKIVKNAESGSRQECRQAYMPEGGAYQYSSDGFANEAMDARYWQGEGAGGMGEGNSRITSQSGGDAYGQYQQSGDGYGQYQQSGDGYGAYGQYQQSGDGYGAYGQYQQSGAYAQPPGPGQYEQPQYPYDSSTQYQQ